MDQPAVLREAHRVEERSLRSDCRVSVARLDQSACLRHRQVAQQAAEAKVEPAVLMAHPQVPAAAPEARAKVFSPDPVAVPAAPKAVPQVHQVVRVGVHRAVEARVALLTPVAADLREVPALLEDHPEADLAIFA